MIDIEKMKALAKKFRIVSGHVGQFRRHMLDDYREAATAIDTLLSELEQNRIDQLEAQGAFEELDRENNGLRAARIAYASEFEPDSEGLPNVGNIHANIRKLKAELEAREADRRRFEFLADRYRWAGVHIDFEKDSHYRQHRVTWHQGDGWWHAAGQSVEEAIDAAIDLAQRQEGEEQ